MTRKTRLFSPYRSFLSDTTNCKWATKTVIKQSDFPPHTQQNLFSPFPPPSSALLLTLSLRSQGFSHSPHKHKTILSYPALAWEKPQEKWQASRKDPEKWCESESGAEVAKGESGQEGKESERQRGKERKGGSRCFWINKTNEHESGVVFRREETKGKKCALQQMDYKGRFKNWSSKMNIL